MLDVSYFWEWMPTIFILYIKKLLIAWWLSKCVLIQCLSSLLSLKVLLYGSTLPHKMLVTCVNVNVNVNINNLVKSII